MVDTRSSKHSLPRRKENAPRSNKSSAFKVDDEWEEMKPKQRVKRAKSEDGDEWQEERKPKVHKQKQEKKSSGLSITPVATKTKPKPKKEEEDDIWNVNMNYISAGSSADSDEEEGKIRTRFVKHDLQFVRFSYKDH